MTLVVRICDSSAGEMEIRWRRTRSTVFGGLHGGWRGWKRREDLRGWGERMMGLSGKGGGVGVGVGVYTERHDRGGKV